MRRLSRGLISAPRLSFEAWPDVAAKLAACIALGLRWNCFDGSHPEDTNGRLRRTRGSGDRAASMNAALARDPLPLIDPAIGKTSRRRNRQKDAKPRSRHLPCSGQCQGPQMAST
jgi:hypothetical protein